MEDGGGSLCLSVLPHLVDMKENNFLRRGFIKQNRITDTGINVYLLGGFNLTMSVDLECIFFNIKQRFDVL